MKYLGQWKCGPWLERWPSCEGTRPNAPSPPTRRYVINQHHLNGWHTSATGSQGSHNSPVIPGILNSSMTLFIFQWVVGDGRASVVWMKTRPAFSPPASNSSQPFAFGLSLLMPKLSKWLERKEMLRGVLVEQTQTPRRKGSSADDTGLIQSHPLRVLPSAKFCEDSSVMGNRDDNWPCVFSFIQVFIEVFRHLNKFSGHGTVEEKKYLSSNNCQSLIYH